MISICKFMRFFMHLELTLNRVFDFEMQVRKNHEIAQNLSMMVRRYTRMIYLSHLNVLMFRTCK